MTSQLRKKKWFVWLFTFLLVACCWQLATVTVAAASGMTPPMDSDISFESPWQYQWGDSAVDPDGHYLRLMEPLNSPGWRTVTTPEAIEDRNNRNVLWMRTVVSIDQCTNCSMYAEQIAESFELYLNGRLVQKSGTIQEDQPLPFAGKPLILFSLPVEELKKEGITSAVLTLRIQGYSDQTGLWGPIWYGEYNELSKRLVQTYLLQLISGLISASIGLIALLTAFRTRNPAIYFSFGIFAITIGTYNIIGVNAIQLVFDYPLFLGYLDILFAHLTPIAFFTYVYYLLGAGKWSLHRLILTIHTIFSSVLLTAVYLGFLGIQKTQMPIQLLLLISLMTILAVNFLQYREVTLETRRFVLSVSLLMLTSIHDLMVGLKWLPYTFYLNYLGMLVLIGFQVYLFSIRSTETQIKLQLELDALKETALSMIEKNQQLANYTEIQEQKAKELRQKNEEMQQIIEIKDQILANTSHELRTPINGIIGIAESLVDSMRDDAEAEMRRNLGMIISSGRRLSNLVNDILDYSRMRNNQLTLRTGKVDVSIVASMVNELCRPLIGSKLIELRNEIEADFPLVTADENRLHQILYNLISNAIKFTPSGDIVITGKRVGDYAEITVRDTGIGIPVDKQKQIFNTFEQVDGSTAREFGGSGLGLAVTKQLVLLQGGDIWVESEVHNYSAFTFRLPIYLEMDVANVIRDGNQAGNRILETKEELPAWHANQSKMDTEGEYNILIVDDEPLNLQVIINHLMPLHYGMTTATDGIEALAYLHGNKVYDLVLLDVMMPRMSGYEVCERIRAKFQANELPVIILTAKNSTEDLIKGFQVGANDYLPKPFARQELIARIQTHLKLTRQHRSLKVMKERLEQLLDRRNDHDSG